jgi:hypothetical protein
LWYIRAMSIRREAGSIWITFMKKMNSMRLCWLLLVLPLQLIMAEDLPKPFTFARYQGMSDRSPFAVATSVAPPETANFAKDLYIANAAHSKEGDFVTIASSTDRNFKKYLTTTILVDGFGISNIEWSDKVGATKVTITKEGQSATLSFNEALLKGPPGAGQNPAQAQAAPPGKAPEGKDANAAAANQAAGANPATGALPIPSTQQNVTKPMPVPVLPTPAPRTRGVIPRNPNPGGAAMKPAAQPPPH